MVLFMAKKIVLHMALDNTKKMLVAVFVAYAFTIIPLVLVAYWMNVIYTPVEAYLPYGLIVLSSGAFVVALIAVVRQHSTLYPFLYFLFHLVLSAIISVFAPYWLVVSAIQVYGMVAAKRAAVEPRKSKSRFAQKDGTTEGSENAEPRNFMPRFKNKEAVALLIISMVSLVTPIWIYFAPPEYTITLEMKPEHMGRPIEINFALANVSSLPDDVFNILVQANNLPNMNASFEMPILENLIVNGTKFIGREVPKMEEYLRGNDEYTTKAEHEADVKKWEEAWKTFSKDLREKIDTMTYEEIYALGIEYFDQNGLIVNQTRKFAQAGLAIDYMPLLEHGEIYINDYTVDRINKTLTLMKMFIEYNNLEQDHRGLIIDTERMWGNDAEIIADWYDYGLHEEGLKKLGIMVKMMKEWEWEWKGLKAQHGDYSAAKWKDHALKPRITYVGSATFGIHLDDLWDGDSAQQNFFKISILTATEDEQFDFIGIMTYETGENSEHAVYGYCKAGDFFFGEANVPYIYSGMERYQDWKGKPEEYMNTITRKFRIAINYGYTTVGIWGLTHMYCFSGAGEGWCGGLYDFLKAHNRVDLILKMFQDLSVVEPITFTCKGFNFAFVHPALTMLDAYLVTPQRYSGEWPINDNPRIRPELFP
jgi:hypothetical protein